MSIFENLENLNVSEECFNSIMDIVEEIINEVSDKWKDDCTKSAVDKKLHFNRKYDEARDAYYKEPSSKNGDRVLDALLLANKHSEKEEKLRKAIAKHNKAKAEGRIKPINKEENNDSNK